MSAADPQDEFWRTPVPAELSFPIVAAVPDRPQWLYRLFDSEGRLLYVGVTDDVWRRVNEHERSQEWGDDIVQMRRHRYPGRAAALAAEKRAIQTEKPVHNIVHAGAS